MCNYCLVGKSKKKTFSTTDDVKRLGTRVKKIFGQLSRTRFFTGFEIRALFPVLRSGRKKARFSNPVKDPVLESCSNIFSL